MEQADVKQFKDLQFTDKYENDLLSVLKIQI